MKSDYQKLLDNFGTVKVYEETGLVGFQPYGESHSDYAKAMKPLKNISPIDNNLLDVFKNK